LAEEFLLYVDAELMCDWVNDKSGRWRVSAQCDPIVRKRKLKAKRGQRKNKERNKNLKTKTQSC